MYGFLLWVYVDKGGNRIAFLREIKNFFRERGGGGRGKIAVFPKIMTIDLTISNSMSSFVPKY